VSQAWAAAARREAARTGERPVTTPVLDAPSPNTTTTTTTHASLLLCATNNRAPNPRVGGVGAAGAARRAARRAGQGREHGRARRHTLGRHRLCAGRCRGVTPCPNPINPPARATKPHQKYDGPTSTFDTPKIIHIISFLLVLQCRALKKFRKRDGATSEMNREAKRCCRTSRTRTK